jgi:vitamin B12 transporter
MSSLHFGPWALIGLLAPAAVLAGDLDTVVVTANRLSQPLADSLAAVTVWDRDKIESQQARSLEDLLRGVEGISIGNSGGPGKLTSFFVRGADADQLLVLVDGIRIGSATAGTAALQNLPVEQIERIEFVRGPRSSVYGSEAIGGVLQLFTRTGSARAPTLSVSGGSFGTQQIEASAGLGGARTWINGQVSYQRIDGYNACTGSSTLFAGCFTEEPDNDSYEYRALSMSGGFHVGEATQVAASFWRTDGDVDFDGSFTNHSDILQQVAGLKVQRGIGERLALTLSAGRASDKSDDALDGRYMGTFETIRDTATLQADLTLAEKKVLTLGLDYGNDEVRGTTDYDVASRDNRAVFGQYMAGFGTLRLEASLRYDHNEQFGDSTTGGVGIGWRLGNSLDLIAQYGTGFKAPTFNELYYPFFGNPLLKPERSRSVELAVQGHAQTLQWRISAFDTRVRDLVGFDANFSPANIDRTRLRGLEMRSDLPLGAWQLGTALTLLDPANDSAGLNHGNVLPRRVRVGGHLDIERHFKALTLGARVIAEGARFDDAANTRRVSGHATVDLRGEYRFSNRWRVQAKVANLMDADYETVVFYPQPRRSAFLTIRYNPAGN